MEGENNILFIAAGRRMDSFMFCYGTISPLREPVNQSFSSIVWMERKPMNCDDLLGAVTTRAAAGGYYVDSLIIQSKWKGNAQLIQCIRLYSLLSDK